MDFDTLFAVLFWVGLRCLFGWWTSTVGRRKGRSPGGWFIVGFLLGWLGVIIAYCLGDRNAKPIVVDEPDAG